MPSRKTMRTHAAGVTLVELLIAVAIVGILAAIAYPSYQAQVRRGNRADATAELMEIAQELEKCFTRYGVYNNNACTTFTTVNGAGGRLSEKGKYRVTFAAVGRDTFQLRASLEPGRGTDPECGNLTLDQAGQRGTSVTGTTARCW